MANRRQIAVAKDAGHMTVTIEGRRIPITSFLDASAKINRFRDVEGLGASGFSRDDGDVHFGGEKVAQVSYNGRIWCERCKGEIDADPRSTFASSKGPCKCGNTSGLPMLGAGQFSRR